VLEEARDRSDSCVALQAIGNAERLLQLRAKLAGQLNDRPQVNVVL
jgi:hypothetical protein